MRKRIFFKLLAAFVLVIAAAAVTLDLSLGRAWEDSLRQEIERNLKQKTVMFANRVNTDHEHRIQEIVSQEGQAAGARATVIDANGKVLADSEGAADSGEDHEQQPEFDSALKGKVASRHPAKPLFGHSFPLRCGSDLRRGGAAGVSAVGPGSRKARRPAQIAARFAVAFLVAILMAGVAAQLIGKTAAADRRVFGADRRRRSDGAHRGEVATMRLDKSRPRSTRPRVTWKRISPLCRPASASWRPC